MTFENRELSTDYFYFILLREQYCPMLSTLQQEKIALESRTLFHHFATLGSLLSWPNLRKEISFEFLDLYRNIGETFAIDRGRTGRCKSQLDLTRSLLVETFNEAKRVASDVILARIIAV